MKVLITDAEYSDLGLEQGILEAGGFEVARAQCRSPAEIIQAGRGAEALLVQYAPITRPVLQGLPDLRIVSRYGVGVDNVDLEAAREQGVWVANVPDYGTEEVAAHAAAMIFALLRHLPLYDRDVRAGRWHYLSTGPLRRTRLLTLGVLGLGRIGRTVAERTGAWFAHTLGHDPYLPRHAWPAGVRSATPEEIFAQSQVVSLHVPLSSETAGLVNRRLLERLQPGSFLVNTARGRVVVLEDLLWALDAGHLAGAALDVLPEEPPAAGQPILQHPRVLLSPHAAFFSLEAEEDLRRKAAWNVVGWARDGRPPYTLVEGRPR